MNIKYIYLIRYFNYIYNKKHLENILLRKRKRKEKQSVLLIS